MDMAANGETGMLVAAGLLAVVGLTLVGLLLQRTWRLARDTDGVSADALGDAFALLAAMPDPLLVRRTDGRVLLANDAYAGLLHDGPGTPPVVTERAGADEAIATPTGLRWISWTETPIRVGEAALELRVGRDVSARVEAERALGEARRRAEAGSEAKSRLLANVSHEFRTPLNGILGTTGLLLDTALDAEQQTYAHAVRASAEGFLGLVEEMLDTARIEAGRIELAAEPFDLGALVGGVVELLAPRAQGKGCEIAAFVAPDVPRLVRGDADRLRQVLLNVAGNAVKFTAEGGVGVSVERGDGDALAILVEDTGPGIPDDRQEHVFGEYEQAGPAAPGGTGLGLAITRQLVERMGGTITLDSAPGAGARFRIALDLPAAGPAGPVGLPAPLPGGVLLLSAAPFEAPFIARTLAAAGTETVRAATVAEALALMAERRFDAVLADHGLPDGDVRLIAGEARRRGVGRSIVLLSPFERRDLGSPHAAGFDAYLIKPVRARSLHDQLAGGGTPAPAPRPRPVPARPSGSNPSGTRVLLAEDNEINALVATGALQRLGCRVEWAKDGCDALARFEAALAADALPFGVLLTDIRMPGLDGHALARAARAAEQAAGTPPSRIVALTASLAPGVAEAARSAGIDAVLGKPFAFADLAAAVAPARDDERCRRGVGFSFK